VHPYDVVLMIDFRERPSRADQRFLGELKARVQPFGRSELQVSLRVEAPDIAAALARAKTLAADPLHGTVTRAQLAAR
jgi:hypothetical protein